MKEEEKTNLNADKEEFRPKCNAAAIADARNRDINAIDNNESDIWYSSSNGGVYDK